ncbi:hypothetical protein HMPREF1550_00084 [Actinomyces sp. oral taxon 877 str. F0543]|nr:hypothetical protein HMPREF1550_00084 [Actinomyces sp. oral taxon 877 str. F0543]
MVFVTLFAFPGRAAPARAAARTGDGRRGPARAMCATVCT